MRTVSPAVILQSAEYDVQNSAALERELAVLAPGRCVIDFRNVSYIDSTGIAQLVRVLKRLMLSDPSSTIVLSNARPHVHKVFVIANLHRLFIIE
ncbi:MAG TPA: STAS domain-containing protein [Candidatus Baltobacteraceae bacterium]|jgi:stage II sporulation protein AA (anti-sigma F factor antagonist)|nr:STAS domain-containing protein [Candidatus Baltobacteraceae bacterium]